MADNPSPKRFAEEYKKEPNLYQAMRKAGYSHYVAKNGKNALSKPMIDALMAEGIEYAEIGQKLEPKMVENFIAGKLMHNALSGESKGNEALKLLGSMVRYGAFKSDSNTNLIILSDAPQQQIAPEHVLDMAQPHQLTTNDVE